MIKYEFSDTLSPACNYTEDMGMISKTAVLPAG
jgi:hypothetical protein